MRIYMFYSSIFGGQNLCWPPSQAFGRGHGPWPPCPLDPPVIGLSLLSLLTYYPQSPPSIRNRIKMLIPPEHPEKWKTMYCKTVKLGRLKAKYVLAPTLLCRGGLCRGQDSVGADPLSDRRPGSPLVGAVGGSFLVLGGPEGPITAPNSGYVGECGGKPSGAGAHETGGAARPSAPTPGAAGERGGVDGRPAVGG